MKIGIDIGGSKIRIASIDSKSDSFLEIKSFAVNPNFEEAISHIQENIANMTSGKKLEGIGVALPGLVNKKEGLIVDSANLPSWNNKPIAKLLKAHFNTEVKVDNDMAVAALGEATFGFGRNKDKFLYIVWGTGFGAGYVEIIEGKPRVVSIEMGHQIIEWNGRLCACGQKGCAEAYIGGGAAEKFYGKPLSQISDEKVWNDIAKYAAHSIVNALNFFPVDLIVFGGGVINQQEHLLDKIMKIVKENLTTYPVPEFKTAKNKEDTGLYGAISLLK